MVTTARASYAEMEEPTVFIVDDDDGVRSSMETLISGEGLRVASYTSTESFLNAFQDSWRGCIILDLKMPGMSGMELLRQLRRESRDLPVIMVTAHGEIEACVESMKNGAIDFFEKPYEPAKLLATVNQAIRLDLKSWNARKHQRELERKLAALTDEEEHVLRGIAAGKLLKSIAAELDVSLRTVQFRRASIMEKLDVENRAKLVQIATTIWNDT